MCWQVFWERFSGLRPCRRPLWRGEKSIGLRGNITFEVLIHNHQNLLSKQGKIEQQMQSNFGKFPETIFGVKICKFKQISQAGNQQNHCKSNGVSCFVSFFHVLYIRSSSFLSTFYQFWDPKWDHIWRKLIQKSIPNRSWNSKVKFGILL